MGTVITVMNMKGGVGKTTVSMHLGGILGYMKIRERRRRVLLIDYDPQFNLSQAFIPAKTYYGCEAARKTSLSILQDDATDLDPYKLQVPGTDTPPMPSAIVHNIHSTADSQLDIIPSTLDLMYVALGQTEKRIAPFEDRFAKFIEMCRKQYDLIFIDCHPAGSILTKTSLENSQHVLIPVAPQRYAIRGIGLMLQFIKVKKSGGIAPKAHILFNAVPRVGICKEETDIRGKTELASLCMTATMKTYKIFSEPLDGLGFCWHSSKPYSTEAYRNLRVIAEELVDRTTETGISK